MLEYLRFVTELIPRCLRAPTYEFHAANVVRVVKKAPPFMHGYGTFESRQGRCFN